MSASSKHAEREAHTEALFQEAAHHPAGSSEHQRYLDEIVLLNAGVAEALAQRYARRGAEADDLVQVAYLGLVKAVQRYRLGEGPGFLGYAVPTISGEIKRYFRDHGWSVKPPRRLRDLGLAARDAATDLEQRWGRPPTQEEVAATLGVQAQELQEASSIKGAMTPLSLDVPLAGEGTTPLGHQLPQEDDAFLQVENMEALRPALAALTPRDRHIILLRFVRGYSQEQIAAEIGVSQMQVSRLLTKILATLREHLEADPSLQVPVA